MGEEGRHLNHMHGLESFEKQTNLGRDTCSLLQQLQGTEDSAYIDLLRLFAYGTWRDYKEGLIKQQLPEERKFDLLKALAEISPFTLPQDSRQVLPSVVQLLKKYMPRRKSGEEMNFTYVECLLYVFHHLAHKAPNATNSLCGYKIVTGQPSDRLGEDFSEFYTDLIERLSNVEDLTRATMRKLTQGMTEHNKAMAAAKSDDAKDSIKTQKQNTTTGLRTCNNILAMAKPLHAKTPLFIGDKSINLSWKEVAKPSVPSTTVSAGEIVLQGTEDAAYIDLLRLFAYGTWRDYKGNSALLPKLLPHQILKLKQLTVLTLSETNKKTQESNEAQLKNLENECSRYKAQHWESCCRLGEIGRLVPHFAPKGLDRLTLNMRHDRIKMTSHQDHGVELVHIQEEIPHVDGWEQEIWEEVEEATDHIVPLLKIPEQTVTERGTSDSRCTAHHGKHWFGIIQLAFQCIGVVFGDLDKSPLYVLSSTFPNGIQDPDDIFGVLSVIIYSIFIITIGKYTFMVLFANNKGDERRKGSMRKGRIRSHYDLQSEKSPFHFYQKKRKEKSPI
uniref:K+ potassium transporter integral membrane domain-containing protein n=1 Tax=Salix viminalis TaxID=40686 RepID=A0A6N2K1V2_SALVM